MSAKGKAKRRSKHGGWKYTPLFCNIFGVLLLLGVLLLTLPLAGPRLLGYQTYDVVSGSMEPEIPIGSVVYVSDADPVDIDTDEIIAFYNSDGEVVVHRVVTNRPSIGEFVTKGDANNVEDREPIPYDAFLGRMVLHIPVVGHFMAIYASNIGKMYLLMVAACGVMLNMLADRIRTHRRLWAQVLAEQAAEAGVTDLAQEAADRGMVQTGGWVRVTLMIFLLFIFVASAGVVAYVNVERRQTAAIYNDAAVRFTTAQTDESVVAPIVIDFESLRAKNEDIVGWIYCPDTDINFPVLHGETNDEYLHHDYTHEYNINGSVFVDADNKGDFSDASTIIYGHNMYLSGAMFASLDEWEAQSYYDDHPVMWLLTPTRDYQVQLVSGHHVNALSTYYDIYSKHDAKFNTMLADAVKDSLFTALVEANPNNNYIMLSTCAYVFDDARFALHGMLVAVDSAGGVPLKKGK